MRLHSLICLVVSLLLPSFAAAGSNGALQVDGSNGVRPLLDALAAAYMQYYPGRAVDVGSGMPVSERLAALDAGHIDLIMASHGLDDAALRSAGYEVYRFAQMPVVLAINTEGNPMEAISAAQLCGIYDGKYSNWQDLLGPDMPLRPYARPRAEVDMEVLEAALPCFRDLNMSVAVQTKERSGELARALMDTPGAIGMTTLTRVLASNGRLRALALDGVSPDHPNMVSGNYPLMRDVFLVASPDPAQPVKDFLSFVQGLGMAAVAEEGAVPLDR